MQLDLFPTATEARAEAATRLPEPSNVPGWHSTIAALIQSSVASIQRVLRAGHPVSIASSMGKDSTVLMSVVMLAAEQLHALGEPVPPIRLSMADTLVENPEVVRLRKLVSSQYLEYARARGLPITAAVGSPSLSESFLVNLIGGRDLPVYADADQSRCTIDWKKKPLDRLQRQFEKDAGGAQPVVVMTGTRFDESFARRASMTARGETAHDLRLSDGRLYLSPIADWPTRAVFLYLQNAGQGPAYRYRAFAPDFAATLRLYNDAALEACVLDFSVEAAVKSTGCGARTGCWTCLRSEDKSLRNLTLNSDYAHLRGLRAFRDYLAAIRFDFDRRSWLPRKPEPGTGDLILRPNAFGPAECERLLRMVLTLDLQERERAQSVSNAIHDGSLPSTPDNLKLSEPQFQLLRGTDILAIDLLWSLDAAAPPFHAWRVAREVFAGRRLPVPKLQPYPRVPIPPATVYPGRPELLAQRLGSRDVLLEMHTDSGCPERPAAARFQVDAEGAALFEEFELDALLGQHRHSTAALAGEAARVYLRLGVAELRTTHAAALDQLFEVGRYRAALGLAGRTGPVEPPPQQLAD